MTLLIVLICVLILIWLTTALSRSTRSRARETRAIDKRIKDTIEIWAADPRSAAETIVALERDIAKILAGDQTEDYVERMPLRDHASKTAQIDLYDQAQVVALVESFLNVNKHPYGTTPDGLITEVRVEHEKWYRENAGGHMPSCVDRCKDAEIEARRRWPRHFRGHATAQS